LRGKSIVTVKKSQITSTFYWAYSWLNKNWRK